MARSKKLRRIWTALTSLMARPRKRRRGGCDVQTHSTLNTSSSHLVDTPNEKARHTDYVSRPTGLSSQTTFHDVPSSPMLGPSDSVPDLLPDDDTSSIWASETGNTYFFTEEDEAEIEARRRNRTASDRPLEEWAAKIDDWLLELIRLEGRAEFTDDACPSCDTGRAEYRCADCADLQLYCADCTVRNHSRNPWHRLTQWVKTHFRRTDLKSLGIRIQLGHPPGERCPNPKAAFNNDFVILDLTGIHRVGVDYCDCPNKTQLPIQLMRARLFPATVTNPKTAATYRLLEHFHVLRSQSKTSAYEFYHTLARRTDNIDPEEAKDRYSAFLRMSREWSHLKLLKRGGRGHDPSGAAGTAQGECSVECPACPIPGKNLPDTWDETPKPQRWLYRLFVGLDANFRLKRKKVSSDTVDPGLNKGCAYFVEDKKYKAFLDEFDSKLPPERSTCHNHDALKLANIKKIR
ncbi:hypothetical protein EVJ58_g10849, partial [Rhodofomes roseus]